MEQPKKKQGMFDTPRDVWHSQKVEGILRNLK